MATINSKAIKEVFINNTNIQYFASEDGKVYSFKNDKFKELKQSTNKGGYKFICVLDNSKRNAKGKFKPRTILVSRMVTAAFYADGDYHHANECNHMNHDKSDNRASNLEIVTTQENLLHRNYGMNKYSYVSKSIGRGDKQYAAYVKGNHLGYFLTEEIASKVAYNYFIDNKIEFPKYSKFCI